MLADPLVFVDIDTQRDFLEPDGALFIPGSESILANLASLTAYARRRGIPVLATACAHAPDDPELSRFGPHCLVGTSGQQRVAATAWPEGHVLSPDEHHEGPLPMHLTVEKRELDVFTHPDADRLIALYDRDHPTFVVYGVATEYCVERAVMGLLDRGCRVAVVVDAIRAIDPQAEADVCAGFIRPRGALDLDRGRMRRLMAMHDKFKKRFQSAPVSDRTRQQIALEAARRLTETTGVDATESQYYAAKRKAAAVLGHSVRPGDLPSDAEVRAQISILAEAPQDEADDELPS